MAAGYIGLSPTAFRWDDAGRRVVWRFQDFEPDRDIHIQFATRPLVALNDPAQAQPVYEALGKTGPDGLKVLQAARLKQPNAAPAPDDLDLVLADYQYRYGDRQAAIRTADAALKASKAGGAIVPYIAWKAGLRKHSPSPTRMATWMTGASPSGRLRASPGNR